MSDAEVRRVRAAYRRRVSGDLHDPLRPDKISEQADRFEAWSVGIRRFGHGLGRVVEVGAGDGSLLRWATDAGAHLVVGFDLLDDRARAASAAGMPVWLADGRHLPLATGAMDTVVASTLFSSILAEDVRTAVAEEMTRVLRPGGLLLLYDFIRDNPRNADVRRVQASEVGRLFPGWVRYGRRTTLAPPIARRLVDRPTARRILGLFRPLRTHCSVVLVRPMSS